MYAFPSGCSPSGFRKRGILTVRLISSTKLSGGFYLSSWDLRLVALTALLDHPDILISTKRE